jgi:hypothetical protein
MNGGRKPAGNGPRKHGPEAENRRGGAPEGVALFFESAPAEARKGGGGD